MQFRGKMPRNQNRRIAIQKALSAGNQEQKRRARDLGLDERKLRRARIIANIKPEAKQAAKDADRGVVEAGRSAPALIPAIILR
jgi:hypothetical protein